jgi:hypothetical protein
LLQSDRPEKSFDLTESVRSRQGQGRPAHVWCAAAAV